MLHVAIVGAGPAGFHTAGVAPDHRSMKAVDRRCHAVPAGGVRFVGGDGRGRLDFVNPRSDEIDAVITARRAR